jgi:hypothetical protein
LIRSHPFSPSIEGKERRITTKPKKHKKINIQSPRMGEHAAESTEELTAEVTERRAAAIEVATTTDLEQEKGHFHHGIRFWGIIIALCVTSLLTALESTVLITSLPTVLHDLKMDDGYVWVNNVFALSRWILAFFYYIYIYLLLK